MTSDEMSIKLAWISDPHFDHLEIKDPGALERMGAALESEGVTHIILGGDIADSRTFEVSLKRILDATRRPIFYVLGNHDYYFGSVADVRRRAAAINIPGLKWLPETGIVELDSDTALIGHGGWGDAHRGDMENFIILTDYAAISDLAATIDREDFWVNGFKKRQALVQKLQELGEDAAENLKLQLDRAMGNYKSILILTHVTPLVETCTYKDRPGTAQGFPGFLWDSMGGIIKTAAASNPEIEFLVLSGHTHQESQAQTAENLRAWSSYAEYGELCYRIVLPDTNGIWTVGPSTRV